MNGYCIATREGLLVVVEADEIEEMEMPSGERVLEFHLGEELVGQYWGPQGWHKLVEEEAEKPKFPQFVRRGGDDAA